jgi:endonuclease/exonuclease/phosphatase family metal-dependent hydrolase
LIIYGTVLPWLGSKWRNIAAARGVAFAAALDAQARDWDNLRARFPDDTLLVAGDFNQDLAPTHCYGSTLNRQRLLDALNRSGLTPLTSGHADPVRASAPPYACIDHSCLSQSAAWSVKRVFCWPDTAKPDPALSDHFGIAVDLVSTR